MDEAVLRAAVADRWQALLPSLMDFVRIPALSPAFDPDWQQSGHLDAAVAHLEGWVRSRDLPGAVVEVVRLPGRSPLLVVDVPAHAGGDTDTAGGTALLYGHLDKQPEMGGWSEGLGPWQPVLRDGRLYGRGSVDDGYAGYAAVTAVEALRAAGGAHGRCVLLLETGEESGSPDLPAYLEHLADRIGPVGLVVCLDSGGADYGRLWLTTSLRGLASVTVTVSLLAAGVHSGVAGGPVASSFRVLRQLLDRLEDSATGRVVLPQLHTDVPAARVEEAAELAATLPGFWRLLPTWPGVELDHGDEVALHLSNTWGPTLEVIGAAGLPTPETAGNVLRPATTVRLSLRLPPTVDSAAALAAVEGALTADPPRGARVTVSGGEAADGWDAPETAPWLRAALDQASVSVFGAPWRAMGVGGSIPFMGLLHRAHPDAQFVVTGALGPDGNAHVPDESLNLAYAGKVVEAVAVVLAAFAAAG